uniref:Uncharacterized protein n=1 Tax=Meloidogyne enterolobii TaxID=390850 RepID=A0A6V7Y239_MELEN|nr:unnamed protein product [Meloidogyne enterolobii]
MYFKAFLLLLISLFAAFVVNNARTISNMDEVDDVSATMPGKKNNVGEKSNQVLPQGEEGMDDLTEDYDDSDEDDEDYDDMDDDHDVYNNDDYLKSQMDDIDSLEAYEELPRMDNYGKMAEEKEVMPEMNMNEVEEPKQDTSINTQTISGADKVVSPMSDAPSQKMEQAPQAVKTGANQKEVKTKEVKQKEIKPKDAKTKDAKQKDAKPKVADKHKAPAPAKPKKGTKDATAKSPIAKPKVKATKAAPKKKAASKKASAPKKANAKATPKKNAAGGGKDKAAKKAKPKN